MDALTDYQTAETAWRYNNRVGRLEAEIERLTELLEIASGELVQLERNPPMYHLFNWSA